MKPHHAGMQEQDQLHVLVTMIQGLLRDIDIYGLGKACKFWGEVYHSVYLMIRLHNIFEHDRTPKLWRDEATQILHIFSQVVNVNEQSKEFLNLDICSLYSMAVAAIISTVVLEKEVVSIFRETTKLFVGLKYRQCLRRRNLDPSTITWDDIRYDQKYQDVLSTLATILRMAAFMEYVMQYPKVHKSSSYSNASQQDTRKSDTGKRNSKGNRLSSHLPQYRKDSSTSNY